jgi:hypothetical protein
MFRLWGERYEDIKGFYREEGVVLEVYFLVSEFSGCGRCIFPTMPRRAKAERNFDTGSCKGSRY